MRAAKTHVGTALGQVEPTDQLAAAIEDVNAVQARFTHARGRCPASNARNECRSRAVLQR